MIPFERCKVLLPDDHHTTKLHHWHSSGLFTASLINIEACNERKRYQMKVSWRLHLAVTSACSLQDRAEHRLSDSLKRTGCEAEASGHSGGHVVEDKPQLYLVKFLEERGSADIPDSGR
jgi:hypothetical protein